MEHLEEILKVVGGLVFAAIYLFGNQIFKSRDPDEPRPPNVPRGSTNRSPAAEDDAARQRQIQETIRRKIMERRQATATPADQAPVMMPQERRKAVMQRHKETHQAAPPIEPTREVVRNDGALSWDAAADAYEQQMQTRLQEIEATKRRAEQLRRQLSGSTTANAQPQQRTHRSLLSGSVRSTIRNPAAARRAFVYSEVLGKPVSLRPPGVAITN